MLVLYMSQLHLASIAGGAGSPQCNSGHMNRLFPIPGVEVYGEHPIFRTLRGHTSWLGLEELCQVNM